MNPLLMECYPFHIRKKQITNNSTAQTYERDELNGIGNVFGHGAQDFLEAGEWMLLWLIHIGLVDLVRKNDQSLVISQLEDFLHLFNLQNPACRV